MKQLRLAWITCPLLIAFLGFATAIATSAESAPSHPIRPTPPRMFDEGPALAAKLVAGMHSQDWQTRQRAARKIISARRETISLLLETVTTFFATHHDGGYGNQDSVGQAIQVLGSLRAAEAAPLFVDHLNVYFYEEHLQTYETAYPCAGALIEIGNPCLEPLLARVADPGDRVAADTHYEGPATRISHGGEKGYAIMAAYVLYKILGKDEAVTFVSDHLERQKSEIGRQRLERLKQLLVRGDYLK